MSPSLRNSLAVLIFLILVVWAIALTLYGMGYGAPLARLFSDVATTCVFISLMVYLGVFYTKKRWPGVSWQTRLYRVVTLQRG